MGTVYEAVDQRLNSVVAIKETQLTTEDARRAFEHEASLLANLRHRSLPSVIDHFSENDSQYLVMQFIPGNDLARELETRSQPFPLANVLTWGDEILKTLDYLHGHNPPILHRDIKPSNLKLTTEGELFLLDFGLAKGATGQMPTLLTSRSVKGYTPVYAPLEQIHGVGTDPRSDLYAVGATLYHLLTGIAPVDAPTRYVAIEDEQPDPLKPADEINQNIPHSVAAILSSAMAMNRRHRPSSADEMRRLILETRKPETHKTEQVASKPEGPLLSPTGAAPGNLPLSTTPAEEVAPSEPVTPLPTIPTPLPQVPAPSGSRVTSPQVSFEPSRPLKTIVTIFAILIGVFLLAVASTIFVPAILRAMRSNSGITNSNQSIASESVNTKPTVTPTPLSTPTPELAKVRLRLITAGGSGCSTYSGLHVTLATQGRTFKATTNGDGFASFDDVPCGDTARITVPGMPLTLKPGKTFSTSKKLQCSGGEIYLGSFSDLVGGTISEREANACYSGR